MNHSISLRWLRPTAGVMAALFTATACGAASSGGQSNTTPTDPGVTDKEIVFGTTSPQSGAASAYASDIKGSVAYFAWLNEKKGGVNGRKITIKIYDDGYDPSKTVQLVRQAVTQDNVFAIYQSLGTPPNSAIRQYLNDNNVPQLYVATGASKWGADYKTYPWTIGFQPDYVSEGKIYAKDLLANMPNGKVGILYQNDDYGKDYVNGLKAGLGAKANQIIAQETYEANASDVNSQVANLKNSGADVFYLVATPKFTSQALAQMAKLGWKPRVYLNNVSNQVPTIEAAIKAAGPAAGDGVISTVYLKDPANPKWDNDAAMKQYREIMAQYCQGCDPRDGNYVYGFASAYLLQKTIEKMGKDISRKNLMNVARNLNVPDDPWLLPGIKIQTGGDNQFPITQMALMTYKAGQGWVVSDTILSAR